MIEFLTRAEILETHQEQIRAYGGREGVRDQGLLESALVQPEAQFAGEYLHRDLFEMAGAYLFYLVQNHPFNDGNKRVGLEAALLFLEINGVSVEADGELLYELVMETAQGNRSVHQIAAQIRSFCES